MAWPNMVRPYQPSLKRAGRAARSARSQRKEITGGRTCQHRWFTMPDGQSLHNGRWAGLHRLSGETARHHTMPFTTPRRYRLLGVDTHVDLILCLQSHFRNRQRRTSRLGDKVGCLLPNTRPFAASARDGTPRSREQSSIVRFESLQPAIAPPWQQG